MARTAAELDELARRVGSEKAGSDRMLAKLQNKIEVHGDELLRMQKRATEMQVALDNKDPNVRIDEQDAIIERAVETVEHLDDAKLDCDKFEAHVRTFENYQVRTVVPTQSSVDTK